MALSHRDIAPAANKGIAADAGNLYTYPGAPSYYASGLNASWMPRGMARALDALAAAGMRAEQTIVSFNTPIAMRFGDVWIMAETNYSARTSAQISKLHGGWNRKGIAGRVERVPVDVSPEELTRIIAGKQRYVLPTTRHGIGRYVRGVNA